MIATRSRSLAAALVGALAIAGCGLGAGESSQGDASLSVSRDYGATPILEAGESDPDGSETVIRFLDREAEITTRYGGGFVQSIDGLEGAVERGRSLDWFFFVNGVEATRGGAEVVVRGGDRIWWDYRDWTDALRTPAVVGSWPEPFVQASAGAERLPVRVECRAGRPSCERVAERLADQGVEASVEGGERGRRGATAPALRLLVGPWEQLRSDPLAAELDGGPQRSGVFARFEGDRLIALDAAAEPVEEFGPGAGLIAALRRGDDPPAWLVTGTDAAGVEQAAGALDAEQLAHRYAVVVAADGSGLALPFGEGG